MNASIHSRTSTTGRPKGLETFGATLRARREARYLTQGELATLVATTPKTIHRAERGGPVSPAIARELARVLELPLPSVVRPALGELAARLRARGLAAPAPTTGRELEPERRALVDAVVATLEAGVGEASRRGPTIALAGPSGSGATTLARHIAARCEALFPDGVLWIDGEALADEARARALCRAIAEALGLEPLLGRDAAAPQWGAAFRHALARSRMLVVIDGLGSDARVERLVEEGAGLALLVTCASRHMARQTAATVVEIPTLSPSAARAMLARLVEAGRLEADPVGTAQLVTATGGLPRAIELAARTLARERLTSPALLARRWAERGDLGRVAVSDAELALAALSRRDAPGTIAELALAIGRPQDVTAAVIGELVDAFAVRLVDSARGADGAPFGLVAEPWVGVLGRVAAG